MKGMPLPFDFEGKGVLDLELIVNNKRSIQDYSWKICSGFGEPDSVLDSAKTPSRSTSPSTLSSSIGGGSTGGAASTDTAGVAAEASDANPSPGWQQDSATATSFDAGGADSELLTIPPPLDIGTAGGRRAEKFSMEDWESVLSESAVSPIQEQSILRWIMGDVEDPAMGSLNKVLQIGSTGGSAAPEFDFGSGFGSVDQLGFGGDQFGGGFTNPSFSSCNRSSPAVSSNLSPNFKFIPNSHTTINPGNLGAISHHQPPFDSSQDIKPPVYTSQVMMNPHQTHLPQNPSFFFPLSFSQQQQDQNLLVPPQAKRHNSGSHEISKGPFPDTGQQEMFLGKQQLDMLPHYLQHRPIVPGKSPKIGGSDELGHGHQQQAIVDQLYKAAELVQTGNPVLAQAILARLNHQLSPIGKPFNRAAFYCKEALQLLLHTNCNSLNPSAAAANWSPISLVFKIGAYKAFSEISPLIQFANFTCNQALLEVFEGFDRIHIVDFDIGYGGQWASLMQELALRSRGPASLKITALASSSSHDQIELGLTRENLIQFANEINIAFQFDVISIDSLNSGSWSENDAVAVNLPVGSLANHQLLAPMILSFVKQMSPKIVVSVDRGCDRMDLPFANHVIHALQSYSNLLESLDAGNANADTIQKIERLLLQPGFEKIVLGRFRCPEKMQHWRALFMSSGFSPLTFSNFTESQAECVVKQTLIRGFQVEKRQSSLVLCWHRKELISASAWGC